MTNRVDFDKYTSDYNKLLQDSTEFFSKNDEYFARYKIERINSRLNKPVNRILEYGCGIGRNIKFIKEIYPEANIIGIDISNASIEIARQSHPDIEFILADESNLNIGYFDLIFVAGVYHHVPVEDRLAVSAFLYEHLEWLGSLFIFEHNPYNPITRRIVSNCLYDEDAILLKPKELKNHLIQTGFNNISMEYCLFIPPSLSKLIRIEQYINWLPLGGQYFIQAIK